MGMQIILQPNSLFGEFSSISDSFESINSTREELIEDWVEEYRMKITEEINNICDKLEKGEKPYYQFTMSWGEAIDFIKEQHGEDSEQLKFALSYNDEE